MNINTVMNINIVMSIVMDIVMGIVMGIATEKGGCGASWKHMPGNW